jgi:hypothetical protein
MPVNRYSINQFALLSPAMSKFLNSLRVTTKNVVNIFPSHEIRFFLREATYETQAIVSAYNQSLALQYTQFGSTSEKL